MIAREQLMGMCLLNINGVSYYLRWYVNALCESECEYNTFSR